MKQYGIKKCCIKRLIVKRSLDMTSGQLSSVRTPNKPRPVLQFLQDMKFRIGLQWEPDSSLGFCSKHCSNRHFRYTTFRYMPFLNTMFRLRKMSLLGRNFKKFMFSIPACFLFLRPPTFFFPTKKHEKHMLPLKQSFSEKNYDKI